LRSFARRSYCKQIVKRAKSDNLGRKPLFAKINFP
jgi:hypothetical protein